MNKKQTTGNRKSSVVNRQYITKEQVTNDHLTIQPFGYAATEPFNNTAYSLLSMVSCQLSQADYLKAIIHELQAISSTLLLFLLFGILLFFTIFSIFIEMFSKPLGKSFHI